MRNNGEIRIVAELGYDPSDEEIFFCRAELSEGLSRPHEMIVICNGDEQSLVDSLNAEGHGAEAGKVITFEELIRGHYERMQSIQLQIMRELVTAPEDRLRDREWLKQRIYSFGTYPWFKHAKYPEEGVAFTKRGLLQVPSEFLDLCLYLSDVRWKGKIHKAIEVGVYRGSSSYILAAILYRNNPDMTYLMVDIEDSLQFFEEMQRLIPSIRKEIPHTSDDFSGQSFDFCFIDADHSYDSMMQDYANVGKYTSQILVFHDIYGHEYDSLNGGTVRGWQEIRELEKDHRILEFSRYPEEWMGLGVVERA